MDASIHAEPLAVWQAWMPRFPIRPAEEEALNLNVYDLAYGIKVPVTLVAVNELHNWTVEHSLPRGKLIIDHWMTPLEDGRVQVGKRYEVHGPMEVVYRLFFARKIRQSLPREFAALEREANAKGLRSPSKRTLRREMATIGSCGSARLRPVRNQEAIAGRRA
jgi:hypothetical protein